MEIRTNPNFTNTIKELEKQAKKNLTFSDAADLYDNFESSKYLLRPTLPAFTDPLYQRDI